MSELKHVVLFGFKSGAPVDEIVARFRALRDLAPGEIDRRTGLPVSATPADWTTHPNNPMRTQPSVAAA